MEIKEFIIAIAEDAGKLAVTHMNSLIISSKGEKNIVTQVDKEVENLIIKRINERFPDHNIIAEESDEKDLKSKFTWYIDPIDGTSNYSHGDPSFCVSIGLVENGEIKYGCINIPMLREIYYAEKGKGAYCNGKKIYVSKTNKLSQSLVHVGISPLKNTIDESLRLYKYFMLNADRARDLGFCAGQLAYVAAGRAEAIVKRSQHPWDIAAGILLIEEAGGKVTDAEGNKITLDGSGRYEMIATNGYIHDEILAHYKKVNLKQIKKEEDHWY